jgi:hypothetical protein
MWNGRVGSTSRSDGWGKLGVARSIDDPCRKMSNAWAQHEGVEVADKWTPLEGISRFN